MTQFDIFFPDWQRGLAVDAEILATSFKRLGHAVARCPMPREAYLRDSKGNREQVNIGNRGDIAVFVESVFEHPFLASYSRRICVANPEWFRPLDAERIGLIDEFWHKTRFGMERMSAAFPQTAHAYVGFTSPDRMTRVEDYDTFIHCRGLSPFRNSQAILTRWLANPGWKKLKLQAYGREPFLNLSEWISIRNLDLYFGYLDQQEYDRQMSSGGVHLCTSEVEGFGHYINEARAVAALTVVLDASPMNELIDAESGVLIPVTGSVPQNFGLRFQTTEENIGAAIEELMVMGREKKQQLGLRARMRYEEDRENFERRLAGSLSC